MKDVLNIRDTDTAAEKYSRLCRPINLFIFRINSVGSQKQTLSSVLERHLFIIPISRVALTDSYLYHFHVFIIYWYSSYITQQASTVVLRMSFIQTTLAL
jgi:hypothetical protein